MPLLPRPKVKSLENPEREKRVLPEQGEKKGPSPIETGSRTKAGMKIFL